jgi:serine O-acetyltransferase
MDDHFYRHLLDKPKFYRAIPPNKVIAQWALGVIHLLYPENSKKVLINIEQLKAKTRELQEELFEIIEASSTFSRDTCEQLADDFFHNLPELYRVLNTDIQAIYEGDPAAHNEFEVIRTYPGFYAICFYRIAHLLFKSEVPIVPRVLTEYAHSKTGIDIHPSAIIGEYFHIDHGTGIVIGETAIIGRHVKLYQGVTLGAMSVRKDLAGKKRHPTVEDQVVIYSGATILGGDTVIGHNSVVGGNVWLTQSIAPFSTAYHSPVITVQKMNIDK